MTRQGTLAPPYSGLPDPRRAGPMWPAARQAQKVPKNKGSCRSRSLCRKQGINSALGELRSAAGGFEAVLLLFLRPQTVGITGFAASSALG